ncbi:MAG: arginine--tRNA ligase [Clostridiales bacterium]|jgi:arginyl-tRNA synthetase|nr:arginine--tRNA ligase [Clostridiales bacterium]
MDFKREIAGLLAGVLHLEIDELYQMIELPAKAELGDFALPCFRFAKEMKKAPMAVAAELKEQIAKPAFIDQILPTGPYLNFFVSKTVFASEILNSVALEKEHYGRSHIGAGKTVIIDYSSPNIAKNFHVGHLRSTVIGRALYNLFEALGYHSYGINHLGDWGTQFGKLMVAYKKWSNEDAVNQNGIDELNRIYVKFHDEADIDPTLNDEARAWFVKLQNNEEEAARLWRWFCELSLVQFNAIYDRLNVRFDSWNGESFYNDKMDAVVQELKEKDLLVESDGAMIVDLEAHKMPPCLILRRDGGTLYPTRDISAALYRKKKYGFHKCLYVTALDQSLHFAQWFKVIGLMGYEWEKELIHIPFGLVSLEEGTLSNRNGRVVLMNDILNESVKRIRERIEEKNPDLPDKDAVAEQVGIGAVVFNDLYNGRIKDVVFSWDKMLNTEGETGPYLQYTHARGCSVLDKAGSLSLENVDFSVLTDEAAFAAVKLIARFGDKIQEAADKLEPYILSRYLIDLAQAFNKFYHDFKILNTPQETMRARLLLVQSVVTVLKSGLAILGIAAPNKM